MGLGFCGRNLPIHPTLRQDRGLDKDGGWAQRSVGSGPWAGGAAAAAAAERKGAARAANLASVWCKAGFDPGPVFSQRYPRGHGAAGIVRGVSSNGSARETPRGARLHPGRAGGRAGVSIKFAIDHSELDGRPPPPCRTPAGPRRLAL